MSYGTPQGPNNGGGASLDPAAALRGASLAFSKKKPPAPPPPAKNSNGALTAATLSAQNTGGSVSGLPDMDSAAARNIVAARLHQFAGSAAAGQQQGQHGPNLQTPTKMDPKSTSFIAATLAASRNGSPSPPKLQAATGASLTPRGKTAGMGSGGAADVTVDAESIPPTGSLISIFEGGRGAGGDPVRKTLTRGKRSVDETSGFRGQPAGNGHDEVSTPKTAEKRSLKTEPKSQATPPQSTHLASRGAKDTPGGSGPSPSPSVRRHRQRDSQSSIVVDRERPEGTTGRASPRPSRLVDSGDVGHKKDPQVKNLHASSSTHTSPAQASVPRIVNKYNSPQMSPLTPPPHTTVLGLPQPDPVKPSPKPKKALTQAAQPPTRAEPRPSEPSPASAPAPKPKPKPSVESLSMRPLTRQRSGQVPPPVEANAEPVSKPSVKSAAPPTPPKPRRQQPGGEQKQGVGHEDQARPAARASKPERGPAPTPPKPRGSSRPLPRTTSSRDKEGSERDPLHRTKTTDTMDSSSDVFVSAPTSPEVTASKPVLPARHRKTASGPPSPTRGVVQRQRSATASSTNKNQALDSLTSAIMAGSLAAARLTPHSTGTSLPPPVTPIRQKSPRLRQTLRGPVDSSDEEDDRHKKAHHRSKLRKGKHKHHEGSRKRWRDEITPRERKRYEAVWASNRGLHLPRAGSPSASSLSSSGRDGVADDAHSVANVVVREVWRRSRLPVDELMEVWDLVDREKRGVLSRQEFVVGMWLIDQRLKGRKIPTKVSESVWGSANGNGLLAVTPRR